MKEIKSTFYEGERSLFKTSDVHLIGCTFGLGESPLKESSNLNISDCTFAWKYPLWYGRKHIVINTLFKEEARAGIWYTNDITLKNCEVNAPKMIRKCQDVKLENVTFSNGEETLWWNKDVIGKKVYVKGNYFGMGSNDINFEDLLIEGSYPFDGGSNIHIKNSRFDSKDAFWNCQNVRLENCIIDGEFFGWNSENVTLVNCKISSHQGFCYMKNLTLIDCEITDTDLAFEYCSNLNVRAKGHFKSIKNPYSGSLKLGEVDEVIFSDPLVKRENVDIVFGYDF